MVSLFQNYFGIHGAHGEDGLCAANPGLINHHAVKYKIQKGIRLSEILLGVGAWLKC
jgi:hypothetical protein